MEVLRRQFSGKNNTLHLYDVIGDGSLASRKLDPVNVVFISFAAKIALANHSVCTFHTEGAPPTRAFAHVSNKRLKCFDDDIITIPCIGRKA